MVRSDIRSWMDHKRFALFYAKMYKIISSQLRKSLIHHISGLCTIALRIRAEYAKNIVLYNPHYEGKMRLICCINESHRRA